MLRSRAAVPEVSGVMSPSHTLPPGQGQCRFAVDPPLGGDRSVPAMRTTRRTTDAGWAPLVVLMAGIFLVVLDFFIVNVALPSMQRDLHASDSGLEWVVAGYGLTFS